MLSKSTLKTLLGAFGLEIDPVQIMQAWENSKDALPRLAQAFNDMNARQERMEKILLAQNEMLVKLASPEHPVPDAQYQPQEPVDYVNGVSHG